MSLSPSTIHHSPSLPPHPQTPTQILTVGSNQCQPSHAVIMALSQISQISQLLPLDEQSLQQILDYSLTLSNDDAAEHLRNLLGDSPIALEFINSFNSRRSPLVPSHPDPNQSTSAPPRKSRKKKAPINKLPPPRQPDNYGDISGAYSKKEEEEYMSGSRRSRQSAPVSGSGAFALSDTPAARQLPNPASTTSSKHPPAASGPLISDLPNVRTSSRTASPAAKAKINVSGGSPMHGASTTLQDLVISLSSPPTSMRHRLTFPVRTLQFEPLNFKPILPSPPLLLPAAVRASQPATPSSPRPPTVSIAAKSSA